MTTGRINQIAKHSSVSLFAQLAEKLALAGPTEQTDERFFFLVTIKP